MKRYSSGMYVRLAFAIAAHLEPDILVVDEVLAVGDVAFQKKCMGKMAEACAQSQNRDLRLSQSGAVEALCNKAIVLQQGSVVFTRFGEGWDSILPARLSPAWAPRPHRISWTSSSAPGRPSSVSSALEAGGTVHRGRQAPGG